jgi:cytochrome c oxidase subunit I
LLKHRPVTLASPSGSELQTRQVRRWLGIALGSLVLSGVLSLFLVVGRAPGLHHLFTDPHLFRRCLVVHVDLALVVWFGAFFVALFHLLPLRREGAWRGVLGPLTAAIGVLLLVGSAGVSGAEPVLANYIPVVDHPLFVAGLVTFGAGVLVGVASPRLAAGAEARDGIVHVGGAARAGLRIGGVVVLATLLTFAGSVLVTSPEHAARTYYELTAWGGGHLLQFVSVFGMLVVWLVLLERATGEAPVGRRVGTWLFALLALPAMAGPALTLRGTEDYLYHAGFTALMRWGIWPVVTVFLVLGVRAVLRARRDGRLPANPLRDARVGVVAASALLTVAGFVLGALIRGPNTMVPAHYHASIGAVTVAYMAVTPALLEAIGMRLPKGKLGRAIRWQPAAFGAGQLVFALGFGLAGAHGMARKTYAGEQEIRSLGESIGLGVMGAGGLVAIVAGVVFLAVVMAAWLAGSDVLVVEQGAVRWKSESIRSRS